MPLPRLHLFELEDLPWFPAVVRDLATEYLEFLEARLDVHEPLVPILGEAVTAAKCDEAIDLCSGGGGPVRGLQRALAEAGVPVRFTLTDRYPNLTAFRAAAAAAPAGAIAFSPEPVDARSVPAHLRGFRTLFNAFHHFRPSDARAILRDAATSGQPIGVFELVERSPAPLIPFVLFGLVAVLLVTPFMRPFRWRRLLLTYLVPLVPLTVWWDGIVSHLRVYTVPELEAFAAEVGADRYTWRTGRVRLPRHPGRFTYMLGMPSGAR